MDQDNQVILYEGNPLERIAASDIVARSDSPLMKQKRLFLASDVIVGEYGVTGFVVVDTKPEKRWICYTDGNATGVPYGKEEAEMLLFGIDDDPYRLAHYIDTDQGFKMIRYFILPPNVRDFFRTDRYLGTPMINKCACEGTIPDEFDEVEVNTGYAFDGEERELIDGIIGHINPRLEHIGETRFSWEDFGHHVYFSFHPWQIYRPVLEVGEEAIVRAIRNFDQVLSRFDGNKTLQQRVLRVEGARDYTRVLPPTKE